MATGKLYNLARMSTATTGTGTLTLGSAVAPYLSFASAGVSDGDVVSYSIVDGTSNSEIGTGTYTASGTTLTRTVTKSTNSNTAISLSGGATVAISPRAEDLVTALNGLAGALTYNPFGVGMVNGTIVESHSGNAVTFALKTLANADPSATDPVFFIFRNATLATGNYVVRTITAASSVVVASTKTLGTASTVPFRVWILAVDTGSGIELGVVNCLVGGATPTQIFNLNEDQLVTPTATPGNSAGVIYTTSGQTSKPFRKIAYAEYGSGLTTAGTWVSAPTTIQLFGPGIKSPGDVVQMVLGSTNTATSTTSSTLQSTGLAPSITPTSAANIIEVLAAGCGTTNDSFQTAVFVVVVRGSTKIGATAEALANGISGQTLIAPLTMYGLDAPGTAASTTYTAKVSNQDNVTTVTFPTTPAANAGAAKAYMTLKELAV